jgi:hypothetical protein
VISRQSDLVDFDIVWVGNSLPYAAAGLQSQLSLYGSSALSDAQGFVWIKRDIAGLQTERVQNFYDRWVTNSLTDPDR